MPPNKYRSYFDFDSIDARRTKEATLYFFVKVNLPIPSFIDYSRRSWIIYYFKTAKFQGLVSQDGLVRYNVHIYRFSNEAEVEVDPIWSYKRVSRLCKVVKT